MLLISILVYTLDVYLYKLENSRSVNLLMYYP